jgi:ketosteroid isomerase-like protein
MDRDERAIRELAGAIARAESTGDATFLLSAFTEDAVIMPPFFPAIEGPEARALFLADVMQRNADELVSRTLTYEIDELRVLGDWAFERGRYLHSFVPIDPMEGNEERGQYVRIYERSTDGTWKVARVIWNLIPGPEPDDELPPAA